MIAGVIFETHRGGRVELPPESIIGRMANAQLRVDDPRISEAHALVSLRGTELRLLALRGRMSVNGKPVTDVRLTVGLRIVLAGCYPLEVCAVRLPEEVLAVIDPTSDEPFPAIGVVAFFPDSTNPVRHGFDPVAAAHLWASGERATLRFNDPSSLEDPAPPHDLELVSGDSFSVAGITYALSTVDIRSLGIDATVDTGHREGALTLQLLYDTARVTGAHGRTCTLDGMRARTIAELHAIGQPVAWQELVRILWGEAPGANDAQARQRWDQLLSRIRNKLREAGIRSDLVRSVRPNLVELFLGPDDLVVDAS